MGNMNMHKKIMLLIASLAIIINPIIAEQIENYDSGKIRIENIMSNEETGISAFNKKNIQYAETRNLTDLDIPRIAEFLGCKTLIGQSFIAETLKLPVNPADKDSVLARRQNAIKSLVDNPELKKEVEQLLEIAKQEEQEVIKLMSEFFMGKTCPELKALELIKQQNPKLFPFLEFMNVNPTAKTVGTACNMVGFAGSLVSTGILSKWTYMLVKANVQYGSAAFYTAYSGLALGLYSYVLYTDYITGYEKRVKLHALNQLITIAEKFEDLCTQYDIKNQFKMSDIKDTKGTQLVQDLKASRYQAKKSSFFMVPLVHTFLYKVYQQEKHLAEVFACIAEMDAYNAIATKIIESRNEEKNKFCFATFVENEKPIIEAQSLWNVLVKDAVSSSISENRHVILTGPNAGGKTVAIRALLQNILLAQSFGVAAARKFEITMFDAIHSYLNTSDDISKGLSLFASEVKRAQEVLQKIKTLEPNHKFFFALDELFTGTNSEDGEACAYEFVKRIADFDGVQFIYATHFDKLKELGNENVNCVNYKVNAPTKNSEGKLVYPYTLSQGANESRVALDIAREANLFA